MDNRSDTVRSRICKNHPKAIARHYSRADVPHEAARAAANHRHDAALARVRAATRVLISDTGVDADAYPGVATVVYAGCVPHLPLVLPPKPAEKRAASATRFFSFARGEPTAWTWAADVAERPTTHVGPDLAPVQLLNRLLRGFLRRAEEMRDTKNTGDDYSLGWIHVIVEGTMRNDVMMMLLLLSADKPRACVALSDDECLFIPHLVGKVDVCTSIVYRSMYVDGCAEIRYLDPVRIGFESDSSGFGDIESADVERPSSIEGLVNLVKTVAADTRGNFSTSTPTPQVTVGVAQHPGATYSPADVFLCDAAAIRPLRIADTQTESADPIPTVKPGEIYAGLFDATGVLRRFYAMAYYASYLSGSARKSLRTLAAVLETNGVRVEPAVVPPLPRFAPAAPRFEPIVDAYGSDGNEKIRNGAVAVRMTDLPPPIAFSADGVVRYCYPVCRLGRYTDSSDFAYAALRRGKIASHANRKTTDNKADADDTGTDDAQTATEGDDDDDDTDDESDDFADALEESIDVTISRVAEAVGKAQEAAESLSTYKGTLTDLLSELSTLETSVDPDKYSTVAPSVKKAYEKWIEAKSRAETEITKGLSGIDIVESAAYDSRIELFFATADITDLDRVKESLSAAERSANAAADAAVDITNAVVDLSNSLLDTARTMHSDVIKIHAAIVDAALYAASADESARSSDENIDFLKTDATVVSDVIAILEEREATALVNSEDADKKAKDAQEKAIRTNEAALAAIEMSAAADAKVKAMSGTEIGVYELPVDTESPEDTAPPEDAEAAKAAADTAKKNAKALRNTAADAAATAASKKARAGDIEQTKQAVQKALSTFRTFSVDATSRYKKVAPLGEEIRNTVVDMKKDIRDIEDIISLSMDDIEGKLGEIKDRLGAVILLKTRVYNEVAEYTNAKNIGNDRIDWDRLNLVRPGAVLIFKTVNDEIKKNAVEAADKVLYDLKTTASTARKAAMEKNAEDAAIAAKKRQAAALNPLILPAIQYSDRFFAWGHRYACVVLSALPGAPLPLPRIAAHYLYLRTICAARDLVSPDEIRQLHAAFGKATRHPEHVMREFDRLVATHTAIQVGYEGILAPLLIRTVVDPRVSRCVRVRAGDKYGSDYAPYIGLFEFGPTAEPSTSDWPGRKVRIRLSREPAAGTRPDEMVSLLLLDANPDVKWTEPETVFAAIRSHHTLLRDADWFLPIADGMRAGLSKTVVGTWRLRLHFAIQADAEAYATGLVGRLKTRSDYIAAGAESVTLLLGGQAVGVAITMDPVVRETRVE